MSAFNQTRTQTRTQTQTPAPGARDMARRDVQTRFVLGRILVIGAGLAIGAILGAIAGFELGLLHFSC